MKIYLFNFKKIFLNKNNIIIMSTFILLELVFNLFFNYYTQIRLIAAVPQQQSIVNIILLTLFSACAIIYNTFELFYLHKESGLWNLELRMNVSNWKIIIRNIVLIFFVLWITIFIMFILFLFSFTIGNKEMSILIIKYLSNLY